MIIGVYDRGTYVKKSFHVTMYLCYRYKCYKHLQIVVGAYLQLGSKPIGSQTCGHMLASLAEKWPMDDFNVHCRNKKLAYWSNNPRILVTTLVMGGASFNPSLPKLQTCLKASWLCKCYKFKFQ